MKRFRQAYAGSFIPYAKYVTISILRNADTVTIRFLLGMASLIYTACLIGNSNIFDLPGYRLMNEMGSETFWAILFFAHYLGVVWRIYDPKERIGAALFINSFGFILWAVTTLFLNISIGSVTPGTAMEWTLVFASGWALYRTGLHGESVTA